MKNILKIVLTAMLAIATGALIHIFISRADAADNTSQTYTPANFAVLAAEINVSSDDTMSNTHKVMIRTNTQTGQCWILELGVYGNEKFRVKNARWREVPLQQPDQQNI